MDIAALLKNGSYPEAEAAAVELLRRQPRHAQGWVNLGEALMRQGFGRAARKAFERAWLLDPQSAWVAAVQQALRGIPEGQHRPDVDALLAVPRVTVAAAVIAYNEARCIERCVRSLLDAVDEVVVLDAGSTDGTPERVEGWPSVRVIRNVRADDDFAAQRNMGLAHIRSDWVLWVDADEWLVPEDAAAVRELAGLYDGLEQPPVLSVCQLNQIQGREKPDYSIPRFFPTNRGLRYYGRVHEQVVREGRHLYDGGVIRRAVRIRLRHDGYEPEILQRKGKVERNIRLLRLMIQEEPDNPGWLLYLAREMLGAGDAEHALELLDKAAGAAGRTPAFGRTADIHMLRVRIFRTRGELEQAEGACLACLAAVPGFPDAVYQLADIRMRKAAALLQEAERGFKEARAAYHAYRGTVTADKAIADYKTDLGLADLALLLGKRDEAARLYRQVLQIRPDLDAVRHKLERLGMTR